MGNKKIKHAKNKVLKILIQWKSHLIENFKIMIIKRRKIPKSILTLLFTLEKKKLDIINKKRRHEIKSFDIIYAEKNHDSISFISYHGICYIGHIL